MLKLYGVAMSNYFSMIKNVLLEKDVAFEIVEMPPNQQADFLQKSPMGKVPMIETEQGYLTESSAILDYIEDTYPQVPLYPADPFERAKVKEIMRMVEHYIETPTHSMLGLMLGREVPQAVREHYEPLLSRGMKAFSAVAKFAPYVAGERVTHADFFVFWSMSLASQVSKIAYQRNLFEEVPGLSEWNAMMLERPATAALVAESREYVKRFLASQKQ